MKYVLPNSPSLEHLRAQAKDLLRQLRQSDPDARLFQAQHQLANLYGFSSWRQLVAHVQERILATKSFAQVQKIVEHGIRQGAYASDARRVLDLHPRIAFASAACALVSLNQEAIEQHRSEIVEGKPIGDLQAVPIVYAAFSPLAKQRPDDYVSVIKQLLDAGADPSSAFDGPDFPDNPLSVLYASVSVGTSIEVTKLLIAAGANVDDNESLYHSAENRDNIFTQTLLEAGARIDGTNALLRMLDFEDLVGLKLILERQPNLMKPNALIHALRRGRSDAILQELVRAGADPQAADSEGVTAIQAAAERGRIIPGVEVYLPSPSEQLLAACWTGNVAEAERLRPAFESLSHRARQALVEACWNGRADTVDAFIAGGFSVSDRGGYRETPLHAAAFMADLPTVQALLRYGPSLEDRSNQYQANPLQWAVYASEHAPLGLPESQFVTVVNCLIEAGSPPPTHIFGSEEVRDILSNHWPDLSETEPS